MAAALQAASCAAFAATLVWLEHSEAVEVFKHGLYHLRGGIKPGSQSAGFKGST